MDLLNNAAEDWSLYNAPINYEKESTISFKAGAKWQKEQDKELILLMRQLLRAYDLRYPDANNLLVGYTNAEAFDKIKKQLELLQS